jgi:hypothetical protein
VKIARIARTTSRMRATGGSMAAPKRFSICGLICDPRPSMNRPLLRIELERCQ